MPLKRAVSKPRSNRVYRYRLILHLVGRGPLLPCKGTPSVPRAIGYQLYVLVVCAIAGNRVNAHEHLELFAFLSIAVLTLNDLMDSAWRNNNFVASLKLIRATVIKIDDHHAFENRVDLGALLVLVAVLAGELREGSDLQAAISGREYVRY